MNPNIKYVISETIKICKELMFRNNRFNESKSKRQKSISERVLRESLTSLISISKICEARGNINPLLNSIKFGDNLKELYELSFGAEDLETGRADFASNSGSEYNFIYDIAALKNMSDSEKKDFIAARHLYNKINDKEFKDKIAEFQELFNDNQKLKQVIEATEEKFADSEVIDKKAEKAHKKKVEDYKNNSEKLKDFADIIMELMNKCFDFFTSNEFETLNTLLEEYDLIGIYNILKEKDGELKEYLDSIRSEPKSFIKPEIDKTREEREETLKRENEKIVGRFKSLLNTVNTDEEVNKFLLIRGYDTDKYKYTGSTILINLVNYGLIDALKYVLEEWLPEKIELSVLYKNAEIIENCEEQNIEVNNVVNSIEEEINQIKYEMNEIELSSSEYREYEERLDWLLELLKYTKVPCDINLELLNISYTEHALGSKTGMTAYGIAQTIKPPQFENSIAAFDNFKSKVSEIFKNKDYNISPYTMDDFTLLRTTERSFYERNTKKLWTTLEHIWQNYDMSDYEGEKYTQRDLDDIFHSSDYYKIIKMLPDKGKTKMLQTLEKNIEEGQSKVSSLKELEKDRDKVEKNRKVIEKNIEEDQLSILNLKEHIKDNTPRSVIERINKEIRFLQKNINRNEKALAKIDTANVYINNLNKDISKIEANIIKSFTDKLKERKDITPEQMEKIIDEVKYNIHKEIWED